MANKTLLVAQREYLDNVRTKTFWLGILAFPAIFAISIGVGWLMQKTKAQQPYTVLDLTEAKLGARIEANARANDQLASMRRFARDINQSAETLAKLDAIDVTDPETFPKEVRDFHAKVDPARVEQLQRMIDSIAAKYHFVPLAELGATEGTREAREKTLSEQVRSGKLFAYFVIDGNPVVDAANLTYVSNNLTDDALREWYAGAATRIVRKLRVAEAKIEPKIARHIQESINFKPQQVTASGAIEDVKDEEKANKFAPVAFVYLLWIAVFTAAQMLLTNTVEEKSNRIIEVLLSSVSPGQLMAGKIWGIGATGLTIVGSWAIFGLIGVNLGAMLVPKIAEWNLTDIVGDPRYLASFIGYFLSGYLLFAAVLVALGSVCNSLKEAQNLLQPVFLLLMIPLFAMIPIVQEPNGLMARVFTYIPIYTPFAMMNRAGGPPATWEYVVTTVEILLSLVIAFKAAGKIFRVGVLMTGNPPKLREILTWLREK
jgi:ABC-2 type transport system permease protein